MKVIIVGGSGFIGSRLSHELIRQGNSVVVVDIAPSREPGVLFVQASFEKEIPHNPILEHPDVVVNLAGRSIMGPWNKEHKDSIYTSRVYTTKNLVASFKDKNRRPSVFIQVSATGFYGNRGEETLTEGSSSKKNTYLAQVAADWEKEGALAAKYGVRTTVVRQGNVLGSLGIVSALKPFYSKGFGGPVGSGDNWFPWIHIDDLIRLYVAIIQNESFNGLVNAVAPEIVRYKDFSYTFAKTLIRPHFIKIPKFLFRIKYKGFTEEITSSQKVTSVRLWELGNIFFFKNLKNALHDILKS